MRADRRRFGASLSLRAVRLRGVALLLAWLVLAVPMVTWAQSDEDGLPDASTVLDSARAEQVLEDIRRVRADNERARRLKLADCAKRFLVNRCVDETERSHRIAADRLRRLERHAQEIVRETRNRERNEARAEREQETRERIEASRLREGQAIDQMRAREADRAQRLSDAQARDAAAADNAARYAQRQKEREERAREREQEDRQRAAASRPPATVAPVPALPAPASSAPASSVPASSVPAPPVAPKR